MRPRATNDGPTVSWGQNAPSITSMCAQCARPRITSSSVPSWVRSAVITPADSRGPVPARPARVAEGPVIRRLPPPASRAAGHTVAPAASSWFRARNASMFSAPVSAPSSSS